MKEIPPSTPFSNDFRKWVQLLHFLKPYSLRFTAGILFALFNSLTNLLLFQGIPIILRTVFPHSGTSDNLLPGLSDRGRWIDTIIQKLLSIWELVFGPDLSGIRIWSTLSLVPLLMMARAVTDYISQYYINWVGLRMITDLRQKVFVHMQSLSLDFYNTSNVGDTISRVVNDCQQAQSAVTTVISDCIKHPFTIIVMGYALISADWKFSLSAVVLAPLCALPIVIYGRKVRRTSKLSQENQGEILSRMHENVTGVRVVKAFSMEKYEGEKFWETCYRQFSLQMKIVRSVNILNPMIEVVSSVGVMIALWYAFRSQMDLGHLIGMLFGIYSLYNPIKNISKLHTTIQKSMAATDRVLAVLDTTPSVLEKQTPLTLPTLQKEIRYCDVTFAYHDQPVLQNVNLVIPKGRTVALVGPSGGGKSTLLSLLPRFYDPTAGRIVMDQMDLREVSFHSLRQQMAIVTQETILFHDTIENNIRYGTLHATQEQIVDASRKAYAHDFILQQPEGYQTIIGDKGAKLSGGQRQRLAIARAILRNPSILLLDEATSALDTESERLVQSALETLIQGRTVLVIAHRLSTVQRADTIVVIEKGKIVEQGTHHDLLATGKLYRKLYDLQFQSAPSNLSNI